MTNAVKVLLQMTSVSLQPVPSLVTDVNRLKNDARKAIEQEFNIVGFENDRTALVLKSKYEILNKKKRLRFISASLSPGD
jgi:hypothetical protein